MVGLSGLVMYFIKIGGGVGVIVVAAMLVIWGKYNYVVRLTFRSFSVVTGWFDRQTK
jgi:hypothetical protein